MGADRHEPSCAWAQAVHAIRTCPSNVMTAYLFPYLVRESSRAALGDGNLVAGRPHRVENGEKRAGNGYQQCLSSCHSGRARPAFAPAASPVGKFREEFAASLRAHVEQAPDRIDEVADPVMLAGFLLNVKHLAAPEVADRAVCILAEDVVHGLVPVLAGLIAAGGAHLGTEFRRVAEIMMRIIIACGREQPEIAPPARPRPGFQPCDRRFGDRIGRKTLIRVEDAAVESVERMCAAGAGLIALGAVHEAVKQDARVIAKQFGKLDQFRPLVRADLFKQES